MKGLRDFFRSLDLDNDKNPLTWVVAFIVFVPSAFFLFFLQYFLRVELPNMLKGNYNSAAPSGQNWQRSQAEERERERQQVHEQTYARMKAE